MSNATLDAVRKALSTITDPADGKDIVSSGMVRALSVEDGKVRFVLEVDPARGRELEPLRKAAEEAAKSVPGVKSVSAVMTAHVAPAAKPAPDTPPPDLKSAQTAAPRRPAPQPVRLPGVERVIAVASGKGGVGKSTVAANLAAALTGRGLQVGLLDADIYGPSQPRMLGVSGRPQSPDGKLMIPPQAHGITVMSLGLMVGESQAVAWRGPMLMAALQQMLLKVAWGRLDVLLVDLPPGTGDVPMTLAQKTEVDGAVVVSTPQDIALIDARKGIDMFNKMNIPVLGIIENMAAFICTDCGATHHPFGHGGARSEAERLGVPFLGEVPLELGVREAGDGGTPVVLAAPDSAAARAFAEIAGKLIAAGAVQKGG